MLCSYVESSFAWFIHASTAARMSLKATALYVGGITVSSSDKRLKFRQKPLNHALGIIDELEHVEYDQTHDLTEEYTLDTQQSHQCGVIAQSAQQIEELKYAVVGGIVGEDGRNPSGI